MKREPWQRELYRQVSLHVARNAPLHCSRPRISGSTLMRKYRSRRGISENGGGWPRKRWVWSRTCRINRLEFSPGYRRATLAFYFLLSFCWNVSSRASRYWELHFKGSEYVAIRTSLFYIHGFTWLKKLQLKNSCASKRTFQCRWNDKRKFRRLFLYPSIYTWIHLDFECD